MTEAGPPSTRVRRVDAQRNEQVLLAAAGRVFVEAGVDAPIRRIAAEAGVGIGTIYRHFPSRADLVTAVYRHQVDACAEAGPRLLAAESSPLEALRQWIDLFVDFLVTKHGISEVLPSGSVGVEALHAYFLDRLEPAGEQLLQAAVTAGEARDDVSTYELLRGIGNLCLVRGEDQRYDPRRLVALLLDGVRRPPV